MEPVLLALLCADSVIVEEHTKKRTIIGTFTQFHSQRFPAVFPRWAIYVSLTNIDGEHDLTVNIVQRSNNFNVYSATGKLSVSDRNGVVELSLPVINARFQEPGVYGITAELDNREFGHRILTVNEIKQSGGI